MRYRPVIFAAVVIFATVMLDQLIKYQVMRTMALGERIDLLPFLAFYHTRNPGIAFSMLSSFNDVGLIILTVAIILFIFWMLRNIEPHKKLAWHGYLLVLGGAIGNLIDRLRFHYVIDYVLFHIGKWSFAIFNLADVFIIIGAIFIIVDEFWHWHKKKNTSGDKQEN